MWKAKSDKACSLVFPTAGCEPKLDFLDGLKAAAGASEAGSGQFLVAQVPSDVRNVVTLGRG
jgi:hypothetical protein